VSDYCLIRFVLSSYYPRTILCTFYSVRSLTLHLVLFLDGTDSGHRKVLAVRQLVVENVSSSSGSGKSRDASAPPPHPSSLKRNIGSGGSGSGSYSTAVAVGSSRRKKKFKVFHSQ
jgi:hypothetical protein